MQRIGIIIFMVLAIALGLLLGTLNNALVPVDLLWVQLHWPLGLLLLLALAIGLLAGIFVAWLFSVLPLRIQLRKLRRARAGSGLSPDRTDD